MIAIHLTVQYVEINMILIKEHCINLKCEVQLTEEEVIQQVNFCVF
jgi:hypothetical protein